MNLFEIYEVLLKMPTLKITKVDVGEHKIDIWCEVKSKGHVCPNCGKLSEIVHQFYSRKLRDLSLCSREVYLCVKMRQFYCSECNRHFTEVLDFADMNKSHTHRQTDFMFLLANKLSYTEVGAIINVNAKTVERIVLAKCEIVIDVPARYKAVRHLGIDELSHRKGKKDFVCVLTDLERGIVIDILPDRKKATLVAHFQLLGIDFCNQIAYMCCDFWDAYISASKLCFPNAKIVMDRFHVTKLLNAPLDTLRNELRKKDKDNLSFRRLKWILYKQYHTLSDEQIGDLNAAFVESSILEKCYRKRDEFHHILDNATFNNCEDPVKNSIENIAKWVDSLAKEGIDQFDGFVKTLEKSKEYIANYVLHRVSNAATEGLNNLIRSVKRTAWGMPNFHNLRLRVLAIST